MQREQIMRAGHVRPRPIRIVYLVPREGNHRILDAIFAHSYARWGGRFSPIMFCANGVVEPSYWTWLRATDPDIIYSFAPLADGECVRIHREIYPAELVVHDWRNDNESRPIRVALRQTLLPSLSTLLAPQARPVTSARRTLFDVHGDVEGARSLIDSFGSYYHSFGRYPFPEELGHLARTVTLTTRELWGETEPQPRPTGDAVLSVVDAWNAMAKRNAHTLAECSAWRATRLDIYAPEWGESFALVVGDTPDDRALFWNVRQLMPEWTDDYLSCARVSAAELEAPETLVAIAEFLRWRNHIHRGSGGQSAVTLRSVSVSESDLALLKDRVKDAMKHFPVWAKKSASVDDVIPQHAMLGRARYEGSALRFGARWREFSWIGDTIRPPHIEPPHIAGVAGAPQLTEGRWAVEFEIDLADNLSPYSNVTHQWLFSRRLRMAEAFKFRFHDTLRVDLPLPRRINRERLLCAFPARGTEIVAIDVPDNRTAFVQALILDGRSYASEAKASYPQAALENYAASDKGRNLKGLLGLCGGLSEAANFLLHPFWAKQLEHWGASTAAKEADLVRIETRLKKDWPQGFDSTEKNFRRLAQRVASEARNIQLPKWTIRYSELEARWADYRAQFWETEKRPEQAPEEAKEWEEYENDTLRQSLQGLLLHDVIFQGFVSACANCHHKSWVGISSMSKEVVCPVCSNSEAAPVKIDWEFRLNEFVRDALKQHGLQSVIWCLSRLRARTRNSFYYECQSDVWFSGTDLDRKREAEFDLLVVADGVSYLCEVKSQKEMLKPSEQSALLKLADSIRPDVVLIAVMDDFRNKAKVQAALEEKLKRLEVRLELLSLTDSPLGGSPYLR